ncbi:MAG: Het-C domain-containing protein [Anaerolineae bacterium]|jgi:hypothetical protein|nr:Het-C domain-containing protein [Anaerolineae bacterium]
MHAQYHTALIRQALEADFSEAALAEVIAANLGQDALRYQLGNKPHFHCDNNKIAESLSYVEAEHAEIVIGAVVGDGTRMRTALGRLCHTVQDFYAHSNYVDLWLETQRGRPRPPAESIDGLAPDLLAHPDLRTGTFVMARDLIYYVPLLGRLVRRIYVPPGSHEAMNLDGPERGWRFRYAYVAAYQRTCAEYRRAAKAVMVAGGETASRALRGTE